MSTCLPGTAGWKRPVVADEHDPSAYGSHVAADYDELHADLDPTPVVDLLAELASGGSVLELGIGTGRVALPLLDRGVEVAGIEGSPEMAAALARKAGADRIPVTLGDFASTDAEVTFEGKFLYVLSPNVGNPSAEPSHIDRYKIKDNGGLKFKGESKGKGTLGPGATGLGVI